MQAKYPPKPKIQYTISHVDLSTSTINTLMTISHSKAAARRLLPTLILIFNNWIYFKSKQKSNIGASGVVLGA